MHLESDERDGSHLPNSRLHTQYLVSCRRLDRCLTCAESERVGFQDINLHISKARVPEALWKCTRVDYDHCIEEV